MRFLTGALAVLVLMAAGAVAEEDLRTPIKLPPDIVGAFLEHTAII